ncbi:MAG: DUF5615 family PIN-like protein [Candidatus Wallbacteria bacterium]|nr:DUF5615 family PIN-like protein [Candidatus Wallbacteria bacterium]
MKFKLDENFWSKAEACFRTGGHDIDTVRSEGISGCSDRELLTCCVQEQRCLVTTDLDFSDIIRFPPEKSCGIAVFRMPQPFSTARMEEMITGFLDHLTSEAIGCRLWIVEPGRIRIHADEVIGDE